MTEERVLPPASEEFLAKSAADLRALEPREIGELICGIVKDHDGWRSRCLNLNPAEGLSSRRCRALLDSDMATRLTEGLPGAKIYPHGKQNAHVEQIESLIVTLARRLFGARYVEWRPVSTTMANAIVFFSHLTGGDRILVQAEDGGGNYSYQSQGAPGLAGAAVSQLPWRGEGFEIDLDRAAEMARSLSPRMIVIGGSNVLFPYPIRQLREIADSVGALLVYDAAHLGLLIAAGGFQKPLEEGAHVVTVSTHKAMGGPVGGLILTDDEKIARSVTRLTFPAFMQTRDQNKYAALALALAEVTAFGEILAGQMVANAKALARGLELEGFRVLAADRGHTRTHQIFLSLGDEARNFENRCQASNILLSDCALAGDMAKGRRSGARLATHELTRLGMKEHEMGAIAALIAAAFRGADPGQVATKVAHLMEHHPVIRYSFDEASG